MSGTDVIWRDFSDRLRGYIARKVDSPDDAQDILQDVFVKIHSRAGGPDDESKLAPWVYRITQNTIVDFYRARAARPPESTDTVDVAAEQHNDKPIDLDDWMRGAISELPEKYREAIQFTEIDGLTQVELAARLGISVSGAKSRVQRGRRLIKEMLLACCHLEMDRRGNIIDMQRRDDCRYCEPGRGEKC